MLGGKSKPPYLKKPPCFLQGKSSGGFFILTSTLSAPSKNALILVPLPLFDLTLPYFA